MDDTALEIIHPDEARVNVTFGGQNGDLIDPVPLHSTDADIRTWVTEAVRTGGVPGIPATPTADFSDFVVDRFAPTEARRFHSIFLRPKTPFGKIDTSPSYTEISPGIRPDIRKLFDRGLLELACVRLPKPRPCPR